MKILEYSKLIAEFYLDKETLEYLGGDYRTLTYHSDWNKIMPVYRKTAEIGLWMSCHEDINIAKLWLKKSTEIKTALLTEETPKKAFVLISQLIEWYNANKNLVKLSAR